MLQTVELTLPELLKRWRAGQIPSNATVQVTFDDVAVAAPITPPDPALALFDQWQAEDANLTPGELEAERQLFEQFEHNVNETRRASGMRSL